MDSRTGKNFSAFKSINKEYHLYLEKIVLIIIAFSSIIAIIVYIVIEAYPVFHEYSYIPGYIIVAASFTCTFIYFNKMLTGSSSFIEDKQYTKIQ
jgi:hypothetical protein